MLELKIPDALFAEGEVFENQETKAQFVLGLVNNKKAFTVITKQPIYMEDWNFRPSNARDYVDCLEAVHQGFVQVKRDNVLLTPETAVALFQEFWQEL